MKIKKWPVLESELDRKLVYVYDRFKILALKGEDFDVSGLDSLIVKGGLDDFEGGFLHGCWDFLEGLEAKHVIKDYIFSGFDEGYALGYEKAAGWV